MPKNHKKINIIKTKKFNKKERNNINISFNDKKNNSKDNINNNDQNNNSDQNCNSDNDQDLDKNLINLKEIKPKKFENIRIDNRFQNNRIYFKGSGGSKNNSKKKKIKNVEFLRDI